MEIRKMKSHRLESWPEKTNVESIHLFCLFINCLVQLRCLCSATSNTSCVVRVTTCWYQSSACRGWTINAFSDLAQIHRACCKLSPLPCSYIPFNALKHYFSLLPLKTAFIWLSLICAIFFLWEENSLKLIAGIFFFACTLNTWQLVFLFSPDCFLLC